MAVVNQMTGAKNWRPLHFLLCLAQSDSIRDIGPRHLTATRWLIFPASPGQVNGPDTWRLISYSSRVAIICHLNAPWRPASASHGSIAFSGHLDNLSSLLRRSRGGGTVGGTLGGRGWEVSFNDPIPWCVLFIFCGHLSIVWGGELISLARFGQVKVSFA